MLQRRPIKNFEWIKDTSQFNEDLIKSYSEEIDEGYFSKLMFNILYLPFLLGRIKIEKLGKLVTNLHDKTEYLIHIRNLKQPLDHGLVLKKVNRVIKFN